MFNLIEEPKHEFRQPNGSYGEGGGQIIRNSVSYTCLLRKKMQVINIRANRPNPGLASQHLESILAMMRISGATTSKKPKKNDTEFDLDGTPIASTAEGVSTTIDLVTAGSVTLCMQCILPYLLTLKSKSSIRIIGGTHVLKSPSFDYLQRVFLPTMKKLLGYDVEAVLNNPGYFPRGGGSVDLHVNPIPTSSQFKRIEITERGKLTRMNAILNVTPQMKNMISQFKNRISSDTRDIEVRVVSYASVEYLLEFENSYAGFSYLAEGRRPNADQLFAGIDEVQAELRDFMKNSAALDKWMQDQLIIYMALSKITNPTLVSTIRSVIPTDHTLSAIHVSQLFTPNHKFSVLKNNDATFWLLKLREFAISEGFVMSLYPFFSTVNNSSLEKVLKILCLICWAFGGFVYVYNVYEAYEWTRIFPMPNELCAASWLMTISLRFLSLWMPMALLLVHWRLKAVWVPITYIAGCILAVIFSLTALIIIQRYRMEGYLRDQYFYLIREEMKTEFPPTVLSVLQSENCCSWFGPTDFSPNEVFDISDRVDNDLKFMQKLASCYGNVYVVTNNETGQLSFSPSKPAEDVPRECGSLYKRTANRVCNYVVYMTIMLWIFTIAFVILYALIYIQIRASPVAPAVSNDEPVQNSQNQPSDRHQSDADIPPQPVIDEQIID
ncbi:RNA 3'-terminal phosphate cyclase [Orchesella cincta]|uniref:RNA 3'-terminal phosphate cyclase n=1 Tax=Orchesella cincta TaxID=48709 RepID=A0A1D2MPZ4_ORCCI|nr:RNA 3'-terminal phosphate cyclase [Orchesella cincta]